MNARKDAKGLPMGSTLGEEGGEDMKYVREGENVLGSMKSGS